MYGNRTTYQRIFRVGDPGIPEEGIILGGGGGFTQIYNDFVFLPAAILRFMTYMVAPGAATIPDDYESARLLLVEAGTFENVVGRLNAINFRSIELPPPASEDLEYIVLIEKTRGVHAVIWAPRMPDSIPPELLALVRSLRGFISEAFSAAYGGK